MIKRINLTTKKTLSVALTIMFCIATNSQAQSWTPLGSGTNSYVRALCTYNQKLFVGGDFVAANGTQHKRVAIWENNNWYKADSGVTWVSTRCFCIYNGELYAGRDFGVSKWDGNQWISTNAPTSQVSDMAVYQNELYAVGGGNVRKWNGTSWSNVGFPNTDVNSLCVYNGELIIAGPFTDIGGVPYNHIAKWNGSNWSSLGIGILGGIVSKVIRYNGELYVTGSFNTSQGNASDNLTKWNGSSWSVAIPGINNIVSTMDSINGKLYLAVNGGISTWNGSTLNTFGSTITNVYVLREYNGSLYIGGDFTMAGGNLNLNISKWDFATGITNGQSLDYNLKISPNPFSGETILEMDKLFNNSTLTVYDCLGNIVKVVKNITNQKITLSRENLANGIYYIRLMEDNKIIASQKIIIVD